MHNSRSRGPVLSLTLRSALVAATALGAALPLGAGAAFAGGLTDPVVEEPIAAPPVIQSRADGDWTGAYGGVSLGYGDASVGTTDGNGMLYGVRGGYDFDFGTWVLGAGLDYDKAEIDLDAGAGTIDDVTRLRVRAGADLGQFLVYGTLGAAHASATVGGTDLSDTGFFGGVGADYKLSDTWTVGAEVLGHKFNDFDNAGVDVDVTTIGVNTALRF